MSDWTPTSRKPPELNTPVLCWLWDDYYIGTLRACGEDLYWDFEEFDLPENDFSDVVAWMSLPDRYKAE